MTKLFYWYPIVLTAIGVGIHFFGILGLFQLEVPRTIHAFMLTIDLLVVIGLFTRSAWGYWLALLLYTEQSIMQPYWGYQGFIHNGSLYQPLVVGSLVIAALAILALNKRLFVRAA